MHKRMILVVLCLLMTLIVPAFADESCSNDYTVFMMDNAELFDNEEKITETMEYVAEYTNVLCYTTDSNPSSTKSLAKTLANDYFGFEGGVVFLIDMENRYIYIYAHNEAYDVITPTVAETITDNVYEYASDALYDDCAMEAFSQMYRKFSGKRIPEPMRYIGNAFLAVMIGVGVAAVWACYSSRIQAVSVIGKDVRVKLYDTERIVLDVKKTRRSSGSSGGGSGRSGGGGGGGSRGGGGGHRF